MGGSVTGDADDAVKHAMGPVGMILKSRQWFHPTNLQVHPMLDSKLNRKDWLNFDFGLAHFGMMSVSLDTVAKVHMGELPGPTKNHRLVSKFLYDMIVLLFLLFNVGRLFGSSFIKDRNTGLYFGDFSHHWTKKRHILDIPVMFWGVYAAAINILFLFFQNDTHKKWLVPFSLLNPADARLRSMHQLNRMVGDARIIFRYTNTVVFVWTSLSGLLFYGTAMRFYTGDERVIALTWATIQTIWAYYMVGITCWALCYFHTVCFYLRLRYKRLNKIVQTLKFERGEIPYNKRNEFLREVIYEHNATSHDVGYWNRFWKWYCAISYFVYVPLEFWFLYACCFVKTGITVKTILWTLFFLMGTFLGITIGSGEMAHMSYRWLNSLCLQKFPVYLKFKMAGLIERLGGPTIGFTCYDFFVVARETFYDMSILLGTYFLLIVDFVISYL